MRAAPRGSATRIGRRLDGELGAVTAEVAVAVPTVVVMLVACLGGVGAATTLGRAHDAAADAARLVARGDAAAAARAHVELAVPGARLQVERPGDLVCAVVEVGPRVLGVPVPLAARSCALAPAVVEG